jgi:hypothetical protein
VRGRFVLLAAYLELEQTVSEMMLVDRAPTSVYLVPWTVFVLADLDPNY